MLEPRGAGPFPCEGSGAGGGAPLALGATEEPRKGLFERLVSAVTFMAACRHRAALMLRAGSLAVALSPVAFGRMQKWPERRVAEPGTLPQQRLREMAGAEPSQRSTS